jgi:hypothetical protein
MKTQFDEYGNFLGKIPKQCVADCSHSGDCYSDVVAWVDKLSFNVPPSLARRYLQDFGAWDDLDDCSHDVLNQRVLWIACCDIKENGDWYGVIS